MATLVPIRLITADEFEHHEFDVPVELVRGEIIEMTRPGARHGYLCARFTSVLDRWAESAGEFVVISNDTGVLTERNPDSVRGPDVLAIRKERLPDQKLPTGWITVPPELVVEVLSPSDHWPLVLDKISEYLSSSVQEVWIVDPEEQAVHVYRQDSAPRILRSGDKLLSESLLPGFSAELSKLFEGV